MNRRNFLMNVGGLVGGNYLFGGVFSGLQAETIDYNQLPYIEQYPYARFNMIKYNMSDIIWGRDTIFGSTSGRFIKYPLNNSITGFLMIKVYGSVSNHDTIQKSHTEWQKDLNRQASELILAAANNNMIGIGNIDKCREKLYKWSGNDSKLVLHRKRYDDKGLYLIGEHITDKNYKISPILENLHIVKTSVHSSQGMAIIDTNKFACMKIEE